LLCCADEKATFERLQRTFVMHKQPLLQPKHLAGLGPLEQSIVREHVEVFQKNGFEFVEGVAMAGGKQVWRPLRPKRGMSLKQQQEGREEEGRDAKQQQEKQQEGQQEEGRGAMQQQDQQQHGEGKRGGDHRLQQQDGGGMLQGQQQQQGSGDGGVTASHQHGGIGSSDGAATADDWEGDEVGGDGEVLLASVPHSRGAEFGEAEVLEMVEALAAGEGPPGDVRPHR
jgi:hypothetical protein